MPSTASHASPTGPRVRPPRRALAPLAAIGLFAGLPSPASADGTSGTEASGADTSAADANGAFEPGSGDSFPALVPAPVSATPTNGGAFDLTRSTVIRAQGEAEDAAAVLAADLRTATALPLPVQTDVGSDDGSDGAIVLRVHEGGAPAGQEQEGYRLSVSSRSIEIQASTREGALHGVRTLEQLFGPWATSSHDEATPRLSAPAVEISDHPRFRYRGIGLDVTRSFYDVDDVETVIDRASRVKFNVLHLHLSDDQGWRIAIDGTGDTTSGIDYSRLTSISGGTAMTEDSEGNPMGTEPGRSGFYTKSDYRRIVEYAASRGITVVPEIDVPGHTNAALHAIPELNSEGSLPRPADGESTPPANGTPDVGYSSLDVDNPASDTFVATVMAELAEMTPGPYLHMGGDESHSTPEEDYREMVTRYAGSVHATGKRVIGWNEYADGDLPDDAVVQYWNGDKDQVAENILRNDARAVLSPADRAYVPQKAAADQEQGATWACGGPCTIGDWYDWDPARELPGIEEARVLGVEAVHWGEWIRGLDQMDAYLWPRAFATAEVGWSPQSSRSVDDFLARAEQLMPALQLAAMNPHPVPELDAAAAVSARRHGRGPSASLAIRASAASADPSAVTVRSVDPSGNAREVPLTSEKDLAAPMVESSALRGEAPDRSESHRPVRVELLVDGEVVADSTRIR